jgi:hypothetical protein
VAHERPRQIKEQERRWRNGYVTDALDRETGSLVLTIAAISAGTYGIGVVRYQTGTPKLIQDDQTAVVEFHSAGRLIRRIGMISTSARAGAIFSTDNGRS